MAHLIDKSDIVAELERKRNHEVQWMQRQGYTDYNMGLRDAYVDILSYIESLEVKEVDLKKEYDDFQDLVIAKLVNRNAGLVIAKHFFELGLKAQEE